MTDNQTLPVSQEADFARTVLDELRERAPAYSARSVERPHFDRAILAISDLLTRERNAILEEAAGRSRVAKELADAIEEEIEGASDSETFFLPVRNVRILTAAIRSKKDERP